MCTYIDNFMLGPITGTNRKFASKYIINIGRVNKIDLRGLNMNIYWHPASEMSCCLDCNKLEGVLFAPAIPHGLLHLTTHNVSVGSGVARYICSLSRPTVTNFCFWIGVLIGTVLIFFNTITSIRSIINQFRISKQNTDSWTLSYIYIDFFSSD